MSKHPKTCVHCEQDSNQVPLIKLRFKNTKFYICPQHLPHLIHEPAQLIGKLPGAEDLSPSDFHD